MKAVTFKTHDLWLDGWIVIVNHILLVRRKIRLLASDRVGSRKIRCAIAENAHRAVGAIDPMLGVARSCGRNRHAGDSPDRLHPFPLLVDVRRCLVEGTEHTNAIEQWLDR